MSRFRRLVQEIHRRSLWQVVGIYAAGAWVGYEVIVSLTEGLGLPEWFPPFAVVLFIIGLPVVVATAFVQQGLHPGSAGASIEGEGEAVGAAEASPTAVAAGAGGGRAGRSTRGGGTAPEEGSPELRRLFTWRNAILGGMAAFSLWGLIAAAWLVVEWRSEPAAATESARAPEEEAVAVLPFRVVGSDSLLGEGMVEMLSANLETAAGIRKVDPWAIMSAWRQVVGEDHDPSGAEQALEVARRLGATWAMTGSVVGRGPGVRISADVYEVASGERRGPVQVEGTADSMMRLVDRLSIEILRAGLLPEALDLPQMDLSRITTSSLAALRAYLEGEQAYRRSRWTEASEHFRRALERDSAFALAAYRLALSQIWTGTGSYPLALEYSRRAARLSSRLPERERLLLRGAAAYLRGRAEAVAVLEELTERYPEDVDGWALLGEAYKALGGLTRRPAGTFRDASARAVELNPFFGPPYVPLMEDRFFHRDSAGLQPLLAAYRKIDSEVDVCVGLETAHMLMWGDSAERRTGEARIDTLSADPLACMVHAMGLAGEATPAWEEIGRRSRTRRTPTADRDARTNLIWGYARTGQVSKARELISGRMAEEPGWAYWLVRLHLLTYPDRESALSAAQVMEDGGGPNDLFWLGALAAGEGRWDEVAERRRALEVMARDSSPTVSALDSLRRANAGPIAEALGTYVSLARGGGRRAVAGLADILPRLPGFGPGQSVEQFVRLEVARALLEADEPREALRYLESFEYSAYAELRTLVAYELGRAYEATGDVEKARYHYARYVEWLERADPELIPLRERAREALAQLLERPAA